MLGSFHLRPSEEVVIKGEELTNRQKSSLSLLSPLLPLCKSMAQGIVDLTCGFLALSILFNFLQSLGKQ